VEAHGQAGLGDHDDLVARIDPPHRDELVVVADVDGDDAVRLDRRVVGQELRLLDDAGLRREDEELRLAEVPGGDDGLDPLPSRSGRTFTSARPLEVRDASGSS
jgi:hypothetical protein